MRCIEHLFDKIRGATDQISLPDRTVTGSTCPVRYCRGGDGVTTTVVQAYRFALDPTPEQDAVLRSHCGGQRYAFNWGLALVKAVMDQRTAEASYARRGRSAHAVVVVVGLQPAEDLEPGQGDHRAVVGRELEGGVLVGAGEPGDRAG
jgi:hypothetical protein